jgi:hypothetical protein
MTMHLKNLADTSLIYSDFEWHAPAFEASDLVIEEILSSNDIKMLNRYRLYDRCKSTKTSNSSNIAIFRKTLTTEFSEVPSEELMVERERHH